MENTTVFLFEKFLDIEDKSHLFEYKIDNVYIWQYIRFHVCERLLEEISGIRTTSGASDHTYQSHKTNIFVKLKRSQFLIHRKDFLIISHPRRVKENGKYRCFVTEEFVSRLKKSYYVFENQFHGIHFEPARTKNLKYIDLNFLYSNKHIKYDENGSLKEIKSFVKYIYQLFSSGFKCDIGKDFEKNLFVVIKKCMEKIYYYKIYTRMMLTILRPKAIFITISYDVFNQVLIQTAKRMKIPTIEFQHGRMGETHGAYNFKSHHELETFPDYVFVYGEYERQTVRFPISKNHIFAVGAPELERKAKIYNSESLQKTKLTVVFTPGAMEGRIILQYALEVAEKFTGQDIRIIYKLHPNEYQGWEKKYPELKKSNLEVVDNDNHDIYFYLGQADYVIGISSTSLFEAMMFKTQILIIKELDYKKAEAVYNSKCAKLVSSVNEVTNIIDERKKVKEQCNCDFYYKKNSIKCMNEAIKKILKTK